MASIASNLTEPSHPYYPPTAILPGYTPNALTTLQILNVFTATTIAILASTHLIIRWTGARLSRGEEATALWFVLCGFIHLILEGFFAFNNHQMASSPHILAQLWREYALSDSRYLTRDAFTVCMEAVTAVFWGPLSFICAWAIVKRHPARHPLQAVVSLGQLYGDVLYYATCTFDRLVDQLVHCRPEAYYFWGYYMLLNAFWIVIPLVLLVQSGRETTRAFRRLEALEREGKKGN